MTLTVDDAEADRLAAELAAPTGEPIAQAVTEALRERLERERRARRRGREGVAERLMEIGRRYAALPDRDPRSADEILGYDEHGLPGWLMALDSSAVVAILLAEPDADAPTGGLARRGCLDAGPDPAPCIRHTAEASHKDGDAVPCSMISFFV